MQTKAIFVIMAVLILTLVSTTAADPAWVLVDTVNVPALNVPVVTSNETLAAGWLYKFEVSGTFDAGADITADAEYSSRWGHPWQDLVEGYEGYGECLLELKVNDTCVEWGPYNSGHVYTMEFVGTGSTVDFQIYDLAGGTNNSGQLTVKIYATPVMVSTEIISGPETVEVGEPNCWEIEITVEAKYADVTGVVVQDGMGADLDANDTPVSISTGTATIAEKSKGQGKHKMRATMVRWVIGALDDGDSETLVVQVCTGLNPQRKQEFTSAEEDHELDGGASASYTYDSEDYDTPETEPVTVDVVEPTP